MLLDRLNPPAMRQPASAAVTSGTHATLSIRYPFDTLGGSSVELGEASKLLVHVARGHMISHALTTAIRENRRGDADRQAFFLMDGSIRLQPGTSREFQMYAEEQRSRFSLRATEVLGEVAVAVAGNDGATIAAIPSRVLGIAEELARCPQASRLLGQLSSAQMTLFGTAFCSPFLSTLPPRSVARLLASSSLETVPDQTLLVDYLGAPQSAWLMLSGFAMIESYEYGNDAIVAYVMPGATIGLAAASMQTPSAYRVTQRREGQVIVFDAGMVQSLMPSTTQMGGFDAWR
jgi:hypothetical protein